jgi:hypothetical protein
MLEMNNYYSVRRNAAAETRNDQHAAALPLKTAKGERA